MRNEAYVLKKANAEMKRELGELRPYRRKAQTLEKDLKIVRKGYETKIQSLTRELDNTKRLALQTNKRLGNTKDQAESGFQRSKYASRQSSDFQTDESTESFRNASDALELDGPPSSGFGRAQQRVGRIPMQRRVTVAPGEASRLLKQSKCFADGVPPGTVN